MLYFTFQYLECVVKTEADIIVLFDTSSNQSRSDFTARLKSVEVLISKAAILNPDIRFGLVQYSDEPDLVFNVSWSTKQDEMKSALKLLDIDRLKTQKHTSHALRFIRTDDIKWTSRQNTTKYVVLVTNGIWSEATDLQTEVKLLKDAGVAVLVIAIGEDVDLKSFNRILLYPNNLFYVSLKDFSALDVLITRTKIVKCEI